MFTFIQRFYQKNFILCICFTSLFSIQNCFGCAGEFELNCPYWFMLFDRAGYMDITYYYPTPRHNVSEAHEMCTGDVAIACWYNGISTGSQSSWLTDRFIVPTFYTGSPFDFTKPVSSAYSVEDYLSNPVWLSYTDPEPTYTPGSNSYSIGSTYNDTGCFTVSVRVAKNAIQGGTLTNTVKMYSGDTRIKTARKNTTVCCVYDTVFVDASAADGGDGLSWDTAYNDLQTALTNVNAGLHGCADKIFVAAGTYYPTDINDSEYWNATFQLVDGVNIYGHFEGWEDFLC